MKAPLSNVVFVLGEFGIIHVKYQNEHLLLLLLFFEINREKKNAKLKFFRLEERNLKKWSHDMTNNKATVHDNSANLLVAILNNF